MCSCSRMFGCSKQPQHWRAWFICSCRAFQEVPSGKLPIQHFKDGSTFRPLSLPCGDMGHSKGFYVTTTYYNYENLMLCHILNSREFSGGCEGREPSPRRLSYTCWKENIRSFDKEGGKDSQTLNAQKGRIKLQRLF